MNKQRDLVVVGAGPAGLMAALTAAENGLSVTLLERKTAITRIHRVDAGAIGVNEYLFGQMVTFNEKHSCLCFPVEGFTIPYDGPFTSIYGFQIHSPGGRRLLFGGWDTAKGSDENSRVGISLSKERLLDGLLARCRYFDVDIVPGANASGINRKNDALFVETDRGTFSGRFVIAADGINSRIARCMGIQRTRRFTGTWRYLGWELEGNIPVDPGSFNFIISEAGTFVVVPTCNQNCFHAGIFTFNTSLNLIDACNRFISIDSTYAQWFRNVKKTGMSACVVTELSPIKEPFADNVLFVGDAAWSREFSNMAALCAGRQAANAVALAFADRHYNRDGIATYLKWWDQYFYAPHADFEFAPVELQDFLTAEEIDYLFSLVPDPFPATMNFYTLFTSLGHAYGGLFSRIRDERPAVMDKLIDMRGRFDELYSANRKMGFPLT